MISSGADITWLFSVQYQRQEVYLHNAVYTYWLVCQVSALCQVGLCRSVSSVCTVLRHVLGVVFQNCCKRNWFLSHGKTMWSVSSSTSFFFFFPLRVCECLCVQKLGSIIPNLGDTGNRQQIQLPDCPVFPFTIPFSPSSSLVLRYTEVPKHLIHHSDDRHS